MEKRELAEDIKQRQYFKAGLVPSHEENVGIRDMVPLYPFLISGGTNTERYYFTHISNTTKYKFIIKPEYFGDESNYTEAFPQRITEILNNNTDARIFCVFDWDTIYGDDVKIKKHEAFVKKFQAEISKGIVSICQSMPNIEYWFLLHFENYTGFLKNYPAVSRLLASYIKPCFPNPNQSLKKLLKKTKCLEDSTWVKNLCANGKLDDAIKRAECNIKTYEAKGDLDIHSYSYVYKVFK